jgi:hypothetical protein
MACPVKRAMPGAVVAQGGPWETEGVLRVHPAGEEISQARLVGRIRPVEVQRIQEAAPDLQEEVALHDVLHHQPQEDVAGVGVGPSLTRRKQGRLTQDEADKVLGLEWGTGFLPEGSPSRLKVRVVDVIGDPGAVRQKVA